MPPLEALPTRVLLFAGKVYAGQRVPLSSFSLLSLHPLSRRSPLPRSAMYVCRKVKNSQKPDVKLGALGVQSSTAHPVKLFFSIRSDSRFRLLALSACAKCSSMPENRLARNAQEPLGKPKARLGLRPGAVTIRQKESSWAAPALDVQETPTTADVMVAPQIRPASPPRAAAKSAPSAGLLLPEASTCSTTCPIAASGTGWRHSGGSSCRRVLLRHAWRHPLLLLYFHCLRCFPPGSSEAPVTVQRTAP